MNKKGFTLLELLVVIAIIGLVSLVAFINFSSVRDKARDAKRKSEFASFKRGLDLYYGLNGMYPCGDHVDSTQVPAGTFDTSLSGCASSRLDSKGFLNGYGTFECDGSLINFGDLPSECQVNPAGLYNAGILATNRPNDPVGSVNPPYMVYSYHVSKDRQQYILAAYLEEDLEGMKNDRGVCDYIYEEGNGVGDLDPWSDLACGCNNEKPYDICN